VSTVLIFTEIYEDNYDKSLLEMLTLMDDLNVDPSNIIVGVFAYLHESFNCSSVKAVPKGATTLLILF